MKIEVFNACLLAGWFLLTLGGILWTPAAGLLIAGVALIALTLFLALRFGIVNAAPKTEKTPGAGVG
jgi:hypothetical protein